METIQGLLATLKGIEIIEMARERAINSETRIGKLEIALERVNGMEPEDREIAGFKTRGGDMAKEVEVKIKVQQENLKFYLFLASHIEEFSSYRVDLASLKVLGIKAPNTY